MTTLTGYERDRDGLFIRKTPAAVLDYSVDWTDWLPSGETIQTSAFSVSTISGDASPLAVDSSSINGSVCTGIISAGTAGNVYTVTNTITTENYTEARFFKIYAEARSV